jgi:hypothetical protein
VPPNYPPGTREHHHLQDSHHRASISKGHGWVATKLGKDPARTHAHWRGFERSGRISQRMHEDEEREKTEIRIRPSGGLTISIQIWSSGGLYLRLYLDLARRRGVKVLAGREFPILSGLWGVLVVGDLGVGSFSKSLEDRLSGKLDFSRRWAFSFFFFFSFFNLKGIFILCMMPRQFVKLHL